MRFVAMEVRELMAHLGYREFYKMVGRSERLEMRRAVDHWKARTLDFSRILWKPTVPREVKRTFRFPQEHGLEEALDATTLIPLCRPALESGTPVTATLPIQNGNRVVGTMLGSEVTRRWGAAGLPDDTIRLRFQGSAGQSFGAFVPPGMTLSLEGDANDYVGKGLSGGRIVVVPPAGATFVPEENVIVGNVAFYGATAGEAFIRGVAGERFCVRNTGVTAVVEAIGDHGCEYMTGGRVVVLGPTGRNFGAGMSGGVAYVLDEAGDFATRCNTELVGLWAGWRTRPRRAELKELVRRHATAHEERAGGADPEGVGRLPPALRPRHAERLPPRPRGAGADAGEGAFRGRGRHGGLRGERPGRRARERELTMGKPTGFLEFREGGASRQRAPEERVKDWEESHPEVPEELLRRQGARCMDCGTPFCHTGQADRRDGLGLPGQQPDPRLERPRLPRAVARGGDPPPPDEQLPRVHRPRLPRPVRGLLHARAQRRRGDDQDDRVRHRRPRLRRGLGPRRSRRRRGPGKRVAVVGSGPAGLACAAQLNKAGHTVTVFERADRIGGLLMYGIPNMKLDKRLVERRVRLMADAGIRFVTGVEVGRDVPSQSLVEDCDAAVLCIGATVARDLHGRGPEPLRDPPRDGVPPREHAQPPRLGPRRRPLPLGRRGRTSSSSAAATRGPTASGTALRHGAASVVQLEILPRPPDRRAPDNPWPQWPKLYKLDYGQEEAAALQGADPRRYAVQTKRFVGDAEGRVREVHTVEVEWRKGPDGRPQIHERPGNRAGRPGRARPPRPRLPRPGAARADPRPRDQARRARERRHRRREDDERPGGLRRGGRGEGPVARRLGDPRGAQGRPRGRPPPDVRRDVPALTAARQTDIMHGRPSGPREGDPSMTHALSGLEPKLLWDHFAALAAIPRGSKNEAAATAHVVAVAARLGLPAKVDSVGNVLITKPGTKGLETKPRRRPPGAPRHGVREELGHRPRLHEGPDPPRGDRGRGEGRRHDARRRQRHRLRRGARPPRVEGRRPPAARVPLHDRRGDRPDGGQRAHPDVPRRRRRMLNLDTEEEGAIYVGCAGGLDTMAVDHGRARRAGGRDLRRTASRSPACAAGTRAATSTRGA